MWMSNQLTRIYWVVQIKALLDIQKDYKVKYNRLKR
jgi:hypothetical protein